jgi:hypothetical protein
MEIPQRGGLPHSDIHGSKPARGSPWLFAACHVLHRLLVPRHPPNALLSLKTQPPDTSSGGPPCTETILSYSRQVSVAGCQRQHSANSQRPCPRTIPYWIILTQHTTDASEHIATVAGGTHPPRETLAGHRPHPVRLATAARPETHQNLIHN